jgi:tetratricopeptide (TPR) repeat protein
MWPLPRDRASLLPLLTEDQRIVEETANADNARDAQIHANALFRVGEIHRRLGNLREAETILEASAGAFRALAYLSDPQNEDWAAVAQMTQASLAVQGGRTEEGFAVMEQLMGETGVAPSFETMPEMRAFALELWEILLEDRDEPERLYEIAGIALAYLDPLSSPRERRMYAMATKRRADAAQKLGRQAEASETYERAITRLRAQGLANVGLALPQAKLAYAELLIEQDRTKEALRLTGSACIELVKLVLPQTLRRRPGSNRSPRAESN